MASSLEVFKKLINILKQKYIKCGTRLKSPHPQIRMWNSRDKEIHNCHALLYAPPSDKNPGCCCKR